MAERVSAPLCGARRSAVTAPATAPVSRVRIVLVLLFIPPLLLELLRAIFVWFVLFRIVNAYNRARAILFVKSRFIFSFV
jgi:hypothetical protein